MEFVFWEWVNTLARWLHIVAAVAWIGSSFYFMALDASLRKRPHLPQGVQGEAWQVHGGGFYNMVKYLVAPSQMPAELTWFKWEAYTTWLSGFFLLCVLYYRGADLLLIDQSVMALTQGQAIGLSVGLLAAGWIVYDLMCRSPLGKHNGALAAVGFVFLVAACWGTTHVFSPRGAMLQMGALIGTMMVANVFLLIIPNQRKVVATLLAGGTPDASLGKAAKQRSMHNNYLTLPVVFLMIGNHYPLTYATRYNWLIFAVILVVGASVRHFFNTKHAGKPAPWWTWAVAAAGIVLTAWLSAQGSADGGPAAGAATSTTATFAQAQEVVMNRCSMCHTAAPAWDGINAPPHGVILDNPGDILRHADDIRRQAALSSAMPPGNVTLITPEERAILAAWSAGAASPHVASASVP
ncbi:urate hydroxylase PuuD [Nitrospirillum amazonense]|uniref:urate hydroxylase PuuD n=1 Tax=Nitrospirillum amazonense TaxID=28077 RepID=UPI002412379E|nr:urate hydroxylase PuuD [Nitrospirillum amazonense]MDG3440009.1 urate hydroxylase PuuD [Nitrospirillum amazonense]